MKPKKKDNKSKPRELAKKARDLGLDIKPRQMPMRLPNDPKEVTLLIAESERVSKLGNQWYQAETPNHIAAELCMRQGWAFALAAAWLRCKLNGELLPESEQKK